MTVPTPPPSPSGSDWPAQATDAIVSVVDVVKEKVSGPATSVARAVVYGTLFAILGTALLVVTLVLLHRGIEIAVRVGLEAADAYKPGRANWIADTILGGSLALGGYLLIGRGSKAAAAQ